MDRPSPAWAGVSGSCSSAEAEDVAHRQAICLQHGLRSSQYASDLPVGSEYDAAAEMAPKPKRHQHAHRGHRPCHFS